MAQRHEVSGIERIRHNHITRDVKPLGQCPACDVTHSVDSVFAAVGLISLTDKR